MPPPRKPYNPEYVRQHIRERVVGEDRGHDSECWIWQSGINGCGYPTGRPSGCSHGGMHRHSYEAFVGAIPPRFVIDHLCCQRACVNPAHLEAVTVSENVRRAAERDCNGNWGGRGRRRTTARKTGGRRAAPDSGPLAQDMLALHVEKRPTR